MKVLVVTAHPSPLGHVHKIATTYADAKKKKGDEVKIIDLYAKENECDYLYFTNIREMTAPPMQKTFEDQVSWADEIVVVHPLWWGLPPAIMKNWVDVTFWVRFAYRYTPTGDVQGLLEGKHAKIFATAGGTAWFHYLPFFPLMSYWNLVFRFTGVRPLSVRVCGNLDKWRGERADKHFERFLSEVKVLA